MVTKENQAIFHKNKKTIQNHIRNTWISNVQVLLGSADNVIEKYQMFSEKSLNSIEELPCWPATKKPLPDFPFAKEGHVYFEVDLRNHVNAS